MPHRLWLSWKPTLGHFGEEVNCFPRVLAFPGSFFSAMISWLFSLVYLRALLTQCGSLLSCFCFQKHFHAIRFRRGANFLLLMPRQKKSPSPKIESTTRLKFSAWNNKKEDGDEWLESLLTFEPERSCLSQFPSLRLRRPNLTRSERKVLHLQNSFPIVFENFQGFLMMNKWTSFSVHAEIKLEKFATRVYFYFHDLAISQMQLKCEKNASHEVDVVVKKYASIKYENSSADGFLFSWEEMKVFSFVVALFPA